MPLVSRRPERRDCRNQRDVCADADHGLAGGDSVDSQVPWAGESLRVTGPRQRDPQRPSAATARSAQRGAKEARCPAWGYIRQIGDRMGFVVALHSRDHFVESDVSGQPTPCPGGELRRPR